MTIAPRASYTNPILDTDWPDLDAIRVGADYYLVASSINRVPGLPILHSTDLINWRILGHALTRLEPAEHYALPRHGGGAWAPSIRFHDGLFFVFLPDPDYGISVLTASDPAGPWSAPTMLLPGLGVIDPCPLWTADGRAWLVFGWARSRSGIANRLSVIEISPDASRVLGAPVTVIDGELLPGYSTLEGPKLYERDGWFWIFAPAGGVSTGWQSVFRSRSILGPYEERIVLATGDTDVNGPHQGAWVDTPEGEDWFLHFQDRGVFGRVTHLQPLRWDDEGWPVIGDDGAPVRDHPLPIAARGAERVQPARDDDWRGTSLGLQWHWQANPRADWLRLAGDGYARLRAVSTDLGSLRSVPNVLGQQLPGRPSIFTTSLRWDAGAAHARAGVVVLGTSYAWIGIDASASGTRLRAGVFAGGGDEQTLGLEKLDDASEVELRVRCDETGRCGFDYRILSGDWTVALDGFAATAGQWIGAELGLFACSRPGADADRVAAFGPVSVAIA